jgi:hypothetical protein
MNCRPIFTISTFPGNMETLTLEILADQPLEILPAHLVQHGGTGAAGWVASACITRYDASASASPTHHGNLLAIRIISSKGFVLFRARTLLIMLCYQLKSPLRRPIPIDQCILTSRDIHTGLDK